MDREVEVMAMVEEEQRATVDSSGASQEKNMANQSSRTYLRSLTRRHIIDYSKFDGEDEDENEG